VFVFEAFEVRLFFLRMWTCADRCYAGVCCRKYLGKREIERKRDKRVCERETERQRDREIER